MLIKNNLIEAIQDAFKQIFDFTPDRSKLTLQLTSEDFVGDYTLVVFPWASRLRTPPDVVARQLGQWLCQHHPPVYTFQVVKGFLNLTLKDTYWIEQLARICNDARFGYAPANEKCVVVEFSSPNTNKPLHLGHLRNICLGYAVAELLKMAGYTVRKVNLVNDRGIHICKSMVAYQHFGNEKTPTTTGLKGDHFVGAYYVRFEQAYQAQVAQRIAQGEDPVRAAKEAPILVEAQHMLRQWEQGHSPVRALWTQMNAWVYQGFETTYQQLGITFDKTYYESQTYLLGKEVVQEAVNASLLYRKADTSIWADLTAEGLDHKLVLRADGTAVYITQDLGVADLRYRDYRFDQLIYVVGNEQDYHFKVLFSLLRQLKRGYAQRLHHLSYGMVILPDGKMKSREGTVVDADQLLATMVKIAEQHTQALGKVEDLAAPAARTLYHKLALGALKYFLLRVEAKKQILFDPEASIDFHGHTGPYIQYTYARIAAVLRKAHTPSMDNAKHFVQPHVTLHPLERTVLVLLCQFPERIQEAAHAHAPALLAQYVFELAKVYNKFYGALPILTAPAPDQKVLRYTLSVVVARVIRQGMSALGIAVPDRM